MTIMTLNLPPDIYRRLRAEAGRLGKPVEALAEEWLTERLSPAVADERARAREVLRAAGLLTELGPEGKQRAARSTATLEELILEMRGPKD